MRFLALLGVVFAMISCNVTKFLTADEYIVKEVKIHLESEEGALDASDLKDELEQFYKLNVNKDFKSYQYFKFKDKEDLPWIKRWLKNKMSDKPSILDSTLVEGTATTIENYLKNKKGYYGAEVEYECQYNLRAKSARIEYMVRTGSRFKVNEIHHLSKDSTLVKQLKKIEENSIIKKGDPIDALTFDLEKQRIVSSFQQIGYADFNLNHVEIQGDSTTLDKGWDIYYMINPPSEGHHQSYTIGDINVYTDFHQYQLKDSLSKSLLFGKNFFKESSDFLVRPSTLDRKIYLKKGAIYSSDNYYKTLRKLYSLGTYRFAKVNPLVYENDSTVIDYNIFLSPHKRRYVGELGLESFLSDLNAVQGDQLVGLTFSAGVQDRNFLGGSETLNVALEAGIEYNPSSNSSNVRLINSQSYGLNTSLEFPSLTKKLNVVSLFGKTGIINDKFMAKLEDDGLSSLSLGFNYLDIFNFYQIFSVNASYGYDFSINARNRITFNQIGVNYTQYDTNRTGQFQDILDSNPVLQRSFQDNLFTGFLFSDLTHFHVTNRGINKGNFKFINSLEISGLEVHLANTISNAITGKNTQWDLNQNVEFEKMIKLQFDTRWYSKQRDHTQLAARFKAGIAIPFGSDNNVSYIKQFFVGGPSSIRAWRPMHVGPGTFVDDEYFHPTNRTVFYQRGDIRMEFNLEYRFDLIWFTEGALFLDAGNIWTINDEVDVNGDPIRPGAKFTLDFISQMAIGYGYGFRFDFSYFIIRLDLGLKLLNPSNVYSFGTNPYIQPTSRWISPKGQGLGNFNIAVAYPF